MPEIGVVAIGRNEGDRLRLCLASVVGRGYPVVYVDSASTDGSPAAARAMGVEVVDLDMSKPFSAARARNEGFARLLEVAPDVQYVQFVDGDCEVVGTWIGRARIELEEQPQAAAVCGRRRERFPDVSVYNRLADVEWDTPVGEAKACGGDAMYRVSAFQQVGGFNNTVAAGEEPELCQRLRGEGWKIFRVDAEMTLHDSAILRFGQFWRRSVRNGYGVMDVARRFGKDGLYVNQVRSTERWAVQVPVFVLAGSAAAGAILYPAAAATADTSVGTWVLRVVGGAGAGLGAGLLLLVALYAVQVLRISRRVRPKVRDGTTALAYGACLMAGKFGQYAGHRRLLADAKAGRLTRLIEYKSGAPAGSPSATTGASDTGSATGVA
jgi:hypothetical protein